MKLKLKPLEVNAFLIPMLSRANVEEIYHQLLKWCNSRDISSKNVLFDEKSKDLMILDEHSLGYSRIYEHDAIVAWPDFDGSGRKLIIIPDHKLSFYFDVVHDENSINS